MSQLAGVSNSLSFDLSQPIRKLISNKVTKIDLKDDKDDLKNFIRQSYLAPDFFKDMEARGIIPSNYTCLSFLEDFIREYDHKTFDMHIATRPKENNRMEIRDF